MSPRIIEQSPYFDVEVEFPNRRPARQSGEARLWRAERNGFFYIIFDERGTVDILFAPVGSEEMFVAKPNPVNVIEYQSERARDVGLNRLLDALDNLPDEHRPEGDNGGNRIPRSPKPSAGGPENARRSEHAEELPRNP